MTDWNDTSTLAYCGWVCAGCPGSAEGCAGCRAGGGDEGCATRACSIEKGYAGCWECTEMPCDRGQFGNAEFRGTTTAILRTAQIAGLAGALARVRTRLGELIDFAALSGKTEEEVFALLNDDPDSPPR
ncbi:MAG: DUF3795 domain-containing protein [Anaerolineae bacterium]